MILYLATWLVVVPIFVVVGLALPETRRLQRPGDRLIGAVWGGLVVRLRGQVGVYLMNGRW